MPLDSAPSAEELIGVSADAASPVDGELAAEIPDAEGGESPEGEAPEEAAVAAADDLDDVADEPSAADPSPRESKSRRTPRAPRAKGGGATAGDRRTTAQRLGNFPRADKPADIDAPDHHHLP